MLLKSIVMGIHALIALALIAVILLQSGKSAGLSGAIAGGAETFFGKKKGLDQFFGKVTVVLAVIFGLLSVVLTVWK
ncbi:preprotein translocase, SecG subunit [Candidatus Desulforudis audaxviator MP104C]|uniref:Protein-export membrane protein SecG n=1 Tax=Desulforudis audaxviator (strain MP104C) TaxID=477974 RepID=B1I0Y1_DESAP|nr:preprotein translocase, SecG subunit [Candidatus Desulforudis audaxviator MP104C]AZK58882.1 Preprotein translocase subunit SecG [Candidatus Desulforudis audaxviator]